MSHSCHLTRRRAVRWCADKFGLSWQLVPANLGELMSKPGSYDTLMSTRKIEVAAFGCDSVTLPQCSQRLAMGRTWSQP